MNNLLAQGLTIVTGLKEGIGMVNTPAKRRGTAGPEELTQANKARTVQQECSMQARAESQRYIFLSFMTKLLMKKILFLEIFIIFFASF